MTEKNRSVTWIVLLIFSKLEQIHVLFPYVAAKDSEDAIALALASDRSVRFIQDGCTLTAKYAEVLPEDICPSNSEFDSLRIRCPVTGKLKSLFLDLEGMPTGMKSDLEEVLQKHVSPDFSLND